MKNPSFYAGIGVCILIAIFFSLSISSHADNGHHGHEGDAHGDHMEHSDHGDHSEEAHDDHAEGEGHGH